MIVTDNLDILSDKIWGKYAETTIESVIWTNFPATFICMMIIKDNIEIWTNMSFWQTEQIHSLYHSDKIVMW